ncbi:MAG: hypothetical protein ABFQ82_06505 [Thermodesulfobacteriota bacterium]
MNIKAQYRKISINEIDQDDRTYSLTPISDWRPHSPTGKALVCQAITRPPLVLEKKAAEYLIVTSRQLIYDLSRKTADHLCDCLVIPAETKPEEILALALEDILATRLPSVAEQATCWHKAIDWFGEKKAKELFGDRLTLASKLQGRKLATLAGLGDKNLEALHQGALDMKVAFRLVDLEEKDRNALLEVIHLLNLSNSNQRKLLDLCNELHRRKNVSISEILSDDEFNDIIDHPEANPPQKTAMLMKRLRDCCFPRLRETETEFRKFIGKLNPPKGVSINHSPSFENDAITLTVNYSNREEFSESWPTMKKSLPNRKKQAE